MKCDRIIYISTKCDKERLFAMKRKENQQKYRLMTVIAALSMLLVISVIVNAFLLFDNTSASSEDTTGNTEETTDPEETTGNDTTAPETTESKTETETEPITETESEVTTSIDEYLELIGNYGDAATDNFGKYAAKYNKLLDLLKLENRPIREHPAETDANGEKLAPAKTPANVAFAYVDLTTGYSFSYNADEVLFCASVVKAPYVCTILKEVEAFEQRKHDFAADGTPLYDANGNALFEGAHPNYDENGKIIYLKSEEKYDLSRTWTYNKEKHYVSGSGEIQKMEDGVTFTYLELVEYTLRYSDNIAFKALTDAFTRELYINAAKEMGMVGINRQFYYMSANDCMIAAEMIYDYFETGTTYALFMKEAMMKTQHRVMIPSAVSPLGCAHKYGWDIDSYHDMAIVFDEHPFALVVMTDLDGGRAQDNTYIKSIAKAILDLHQSFYAE